MTISVQTPRSGPYSGDGSTVAFSYTFLVDDEDELVVVLADAAGDETVQTITTDYTVSGVGNNGGGTVTFTSAPASGETVSIRRATDLDQGTDLQNRGSVVPQTLEDTFDEIVKMAQDVQEQLDRAVLIQVTSNVTGLSIPSPQANRVIGWNSAATNLTNLTPNTDAFLEIPLSVANGGTGGTTEAAARTALGLEIGTDIQAYDAGLASIAGLTTAADKLIYTTALDTYAVADLSSFGRSLIDDASASAARTTLGLTDPASDAYASQAEAEAGTSEVKVMNPLRTAQAISALATSETWTTGTEVASTSGTAISFTGLPAEIVAIEMMFNEVSLSGSDDYLFQLGTSGGFTTSGYISASTSPNNNGNTADSSTSGFIHRGSTGTNNYSGVYSFRRMESGSNTWVGMGIFAVSNNTPTYTRQLAGRVTLSAELDRIRVQSSGANTFDNGSINIRYLA